MMAPHLPQRVITGRVTPIRCARTLQAPLQYCAVGRLGMKRLSQISHSRVSVHDARSLLSHPFGAPTPFVMERALATKRLESSSALRQGQPWRQACALSQARTGPSSRHGW
jgi:hypothetical protein